MNAQDIQRENAVLGRANAALHQYESAVLKSWSRNAEIRECMKATLERRKYITRPDVIRHPDGVLEIPLDN